MKLIFAALAACLFIVNGSGQARAEQPQPQTPSKIVHIAVINHSTLVKNEDLRNAVRVIQIQLNRDFEPQWHISTLIKVAEVVGDVTQDNPYIVTLADAPPAELNGIEGFHDNTLFPFAYVYASLGKWTVTLSHEVLEMLADPEGTEVVLHGGNAIALEVADPVEEQTYTIDGVIVSDFVYPAFFREGGKGPFDYLGLAPAPFTPAEHGRLPSGPIVHF